MDKTQLIQLLQVLLGNDQVKVILILVAANVVAGVAASLATRTFRLWALADFAATRLLPYLLGYGSVRLVATAMPEWSAYGDVVWALIVAALVGHIVASLQAFGLQPPPALSKPDRQEG